jgi:hypothetical protein
VAAARNRAALSSTRCAITAHVVQAPDPLQQHRSKRNRLNTGLAKSATVTNFHWETREVDEG